MDAHEADYGFPFGNPDGSRSDIQSILDDFVTFAIEDFGVGLGTRETDATARVIVGPKGSGKTMYLRRLRAAAAKNPGVFAADIQQEVPTTAHIVKFSSLFPVAEVTEKWSVLWGRAIERSLVSFLLCHRQVRDHLSAEQRADLQYFATPAGGSLFPEFVAPLSAYSQLMSIVGAHTAKSWFDEYLSRDEWAALEARLGDALAGIPPLSFYVDAVDEEYAHAPMYWMQCQKGLFYRAMRLLRDPQFGGRLHLVVCVRDNVLSSVLQGEHQTRYADEPHIRRLSWNRRSISYFMDQKIDRLESEFLTKPDASNAMERWLGIAEVDNVARGVREDLRSYILRHTRLLPRDIVVMGNKLSREVRFRAQEGGVLDGGRIREIVAGCALMFGNEQIALCANHVSSDVMPRKAANRGYSDVYTDISEYRNWIVDRVRVILQGIGADRFSMEEMEIAAELAREALGTNCDLFNILWQNGLVGYRDEPAPSTFRDVFFSMSSLDRFSMPIRPGEYVFHSCLIDAVGLRARREPVLSF